MIDTMRRLQGMSLLASAMTVAGCCARSTQRESAESVRDFRAPVHLAFNFTPQRRPDGSIWIEYAIENDGIEPVLLGRWVYFGWEFRSKAGDTGGDMYVSGGASPPPEGGPELFSLVYPIPKTQQHSQSRWVGQVVGSEIQLVEPDRARQMGSGNLTVTATIYTIATTTSPTVEHTDVSSIRRISD